MRADPQTEKEVLDAISGFIAAHKNRDVEGMLARMLPDSDIVLIGTGADEKMYGIEQLKTQIERDFSQASDMSIDLRPWAVSASGPVAWVAADTTWKAKLGDQELSWDWRWTMVLEKRQGKWLLAQSHLSAPAATQEEGESFPSE